MQYQPSHHSRSKNPGGDSTPQGPYLSLDTLYSGDLYRADFPAAQQLRQGGAPSRREILRSRILELITNQDLPGKEHFINYIRSQFRKNRKPNTIESNCAGIKQFLSYLKRTAVRDLPSLCRADIEGFVEHLQDGELKVSTLRTRLASVYAFARFLVDADIVSSELLVRKISIKAPDSLRRDICDEDIETLLSVIEDPRDRAMVVLLLRTGMRIGELLNTRMNDICLEEQTIRIEESEKTGDGRVVYFSNDGAKALYDWLLVRDFWKPRLFYGRGRESMTYAAARKSFMKYVAKSGLKGRGYTLHCLRHTFATNLLHAGVPIEVVSDLLGHSSLEQTQHYARLVDRIREEEYFKAMTSIEGEDRNERK
jgi:integrase/recombinase XerD